MACRPSIRQPSSPCRCSSRSSPSRRRWSPPAARRSWIRSSQCAAISRSGGTAVSGKALRSRSLAPGAQGALDGGDGLLDVRVRRLPVRDRDPHASPPAEGDAAEEGFAIGEDLLDHAICPMIVIRVGGAGTLIEEADEALVDHRLPDRFGTAEHTDALHERARVEAAAIDEIGDAATAELANRGVARDFAGATATV